MATPTSDIDYYEIYTFFNKNYRPKRQAEQNIYEETDSFTVSLDRFRSFCMKGVPQAIEVLFAQPDSWIDYSPEWINIRREIFGEVTRKKNMPNVLETYRRTALSFMRGGDFKRFRHALRLCINAKELKETLQMNPTLSQSDVDAITVIANAINREDVFYTKYYNVFDDLEKK